MKRRGFIRSILGGVAAAVAAPFVVKASTIHSSGWCRTYCPHLAFASGPGIDGTRCMDCGEKISERSAWEYVYVGGSRSGMTYPRYLTSHDLRLPRR